MSRTMCEILAKLRTSVQYEQVAVINLRYSSNGVVATKGSKSLLHRFNFSMDASSSVEKTTAVSSSVGGFNKVATISANTILGGGGGGSSVYSSSSDELSL